MDDFDPNQLARDLIDKVGLKRSYASQLARGLKKPSLELAVRIETIMGIAPSRWVDAEIAASAVDVAFPPSSSIVDAPSLSVAASSHAAAQQNTRIDGMFSGQLAGELAGAGFAEKAIEVAE
jgi:transcriptional regulator with XRE-family HTH domain